MEKVFVRQLREPSSQGREVISCFALRKIELRTKEADGKQFLTMELGDATGRIDGVMWNDAPGAFAKVAQGDVVLVKGTLGAFRESPQVRVEAVRPAEAGEWRPEDLLAQSPMTPADREAAIRAEIKAVKDQPLSKLLSLFFDDREFSTQFLSAPAAKLWHHAYVGGLAEHTAGVCRLAHAAAANYGLLDRDLLIAGCLLHDAGKVPEYRMGSYIDYTDQGRLLGHIVLGDQMLRERLGRIRDFPQETAMRLRHMVLSHHGERDKGSPVTPATIEALVLHHCDHLDSHAGAFTRIIKREGGQNRRWSDYVNLIDRHIYLPEAQEDDGEPKLL
jgi:3'-5' exoribonuclease